mgnify:CR=1 FL=1
MKRRDFLRSSLMAGLAGAAAPQLVFSNKAAAGGGSAAGGRKMIVLGIDGLDPKLTRQYMAEGLMPNMKRLAERGGFSELGTTLPPQSPVAWASFITGMDPGGHGIYDFIHRDPKTMMPYQSITDSDPATRMLTLGSWVLPSGGGYEQMRRGEAFWQTLERHGIPATIYRIPANFPPVETGQRTLSGMGTPDARGTPGTFSYFTDDPPENTEDISGGEVYEVQVRDWAVEADITGPDNPFRREEVESGGEEPNYKSPKTKIPFTVHVDPVEDAALLRVQDKDYVLKAGEWTDWIELYFEAVPHAVKFKTVARFYLKEVHPSFKLYLSPLQIAPDDPVMPVATPEDWGRELVESMGYFYTQQFPEDTKALSGGVLTTREFKQQADFVMAERLRALDHLTREFKDGLLFFYFSSSDQQSHMLWRNIDPDHPRLEDIPELRHALRDLYVQMDEAVGTVMERMDADTTLMVMSDHGFSPFYYAVNLNTWLADNGWVKLRTRRNQARYKYFTNVDWSRTQAYALGLNSIYLNLKGREKNGSVDPARYEELVERLEGDLAGFRDTRRGDARVITRTVCPRRDYHGAEVENGPDLIVGYGHGYRSSWDSPLGEFPVEHITENLDPWSADHCMDNRVVPATLIANRRITREGPTLMDLTAAVLARFGIEPAEGMIGRNCLEV